MPCLISLHWSWQGSGDGALAGPGAPPTRTKATRALLITGFVRPFTVVAAQNLFKTYGEHSMALNKCAEVLRCRLLFLLPLQ